jgi:beta-1,4-mannosyltransferase
MSKIKVACLPVAGMENNPYQYLMIKGLNNSDQIQAFNGIHDKLFGIIRTAVSQKPDYIHFDWETSYYWRKNLFLTYFSIPLFLLQIVIVRYLLRIKLVWTPHNIFPHDLSNVSLHRFVRSFFARQMTHIRVFSKRSIARASKEFKVRTNKFVVVPEGSYLSYYANNSDKEKKNNRLGLLNSKITLLYLGYIKPYKGLDHLIDAFYQELDEKYQLVIAGKSMDQLFFKRVKAKAKDRIFIFDKFIPDDELQYFYKAADVIVLPFNKVENSGSAILAMGFEKAIIAPAQGVLPDRLSQQEELLYTGSIREGLAKLREIDSEHLHLLGLRNKEALLKYKWEDFTTVFQTIGK